MISVRFPSQLIGSMDVFKVSEELTVRAYSAVVTELVVKSHVTNVGEGLTIRALSAVAME